MQCTLKTANNTVMRNIYMYSILLGIIITSCNKEWDEHYEVQNSTSSDRLWNSINENPDYSEFIKHTTNLQLDTFIKSSISKTLFIPTNEAFMEYFSGDTGGFREVMSYHLVPSFYMVSSVESKDRVYTLAEKFGLIEYLNENYYFDGNIIGYSSPLFIDGKYYEVDNVVTPKPNLYQYLKLNNKVFSNYIDTKDSVILDLEKSKPIGFNEFGETVYDSVTTVTNFFEKEYFEISDEFRDIKITMVLPGSNDYNNALDAICSDLQDYSSHEDIPVEWQHNRLLPLLLEKGIYGGLKDPEDFLLDRTVNIIGDSVDIDFIPDANSKVICSNGIYYNYTDFSLNFSDYGEHTIEGESMIEPLGLGKFIWNDLADIEPEGAYNPIEQFVESASNDSAMSMVFSSGFEGDFSITFKINYVFAGDYRLVWRTNQRKTGVYSIYVNDELVKIGLEERDEYDTSKMIRGFFSVLGYKLYPDKLGFCDVDANVNIPAYSDVKIRIEYQSPGDDPSNNGFSMDFVKLILK